MKPIKVIVPAVLVVLIVIGWVSTYRNATQESTVLNDRIAVAERSYDEGLYQQSISQYQDIMSDGLLGVEGYYRIKEIYDVYLDEESDNGWVYDMYLEDMKSAYLAYPEEIEFWDCVLAEYLEQEDISSAFDLVKKAHAMGVTSEAIEACYEKYRYETEVTSDIIWGFRSAYNGYAITQYMTEEELEEAMEEGADASERARKTEMKLAPTYMEGGNFLGEIFDVIGLINDEGSAIYVGKYGPRLIDEMGVVRARFDDIEIVEAGMYDSASMLAPVRINNEKRWRILDVAATLDRGESVYSEQSYDELGTFVDGRAAMRDGDKWYLIDEAGAVVSEAFDDIKLSPSEGYQQQGLIFAKRDGAYGIYDTELNLISDFTFDDIDYCLGDEPVAYKKAGKWGYAYFDQDGTVEVVCEPTFIEAKSFLNGMAAVCDAESNMWGFINGDFELKIDYAYYDALYFFSADSALVCPAKDEYEYIGFIYK